MRRKLSISIRASGFASCAALSLVLSVSAAQSQPIAAPVPPATPATPATPTTPATPGTVTPPVGTVEFGEHRYLLVDEVEDLSWGLGKRRCESWGGHLATIASKEEAEFIAKLSEDRYMFLGASDAEEEGEWVWVDGTPWRYAHWMSGQPNGYGGSENYLATYDDGEWVDVDFEGTDFWMPTGFICEWDATER